MFTENQRTSIVQKYISEMEIIKLRTEQMQSCSLKFGYLQPMVEFKALQLRKVIEQIILASLIANAEEYKKFYNRLENDWNARLIARDLERVNSDFYPKAAINDYEKHIIHDDPTGMTCDELITIYEKLGKYLHANNPFASPLNYSAIDEYLNECRVRIIKHIDIHTIKLIGGDEFLFVVMNSINNGGKVSVNWFERVKTVGDS